MIYLRNIRHTQPSASSIAVRDHKKDGALAFLAPTWDMVSGLKAYAGVPKFKGFKPMSYEEYIAAYRRLLIVERKQEVRTWVSTLNNYDTQLDLYCYCDPMPAGFPIQAEELTEDLCRQWFCHRWLVYKLLRSWRPLLHMCLS